MNVNWGEKTRKIKTKKRYTASPFVLNLSEEAKKFDILACAMRKRIRKLGV